MASQKDFDLLATGKTQWNAWRRVYADVQALEPDLHEADLHGADLRENQFRCQRGETTGAESASTRIPPGLRHFPKNEKCQGTDVAFPVRWGSLWLSACFNGCFLCCYVRGDLPFTVTFAAKIAAEFFERANLSI